MGPDGGTGYAEAAAVDATTIDAGGDRPRGGRARPARPPMPSPIEPGDYPVVLEEYAVVDILDMLGYLGFSALAVQEERSFVEPGKRIGSDARHDRRRRRGSGRAADGLRLRGRREAARRRCVERGRRAGTSSTTPRRRPATASRSTGHGLPAPNPYGPFPLNMVMDAGDAPREELIGGLDRGLLVTRFHYTNPVHPKLAIVTGHDPRRDVPRRGRQDRRAGPEPALHAVLPRRARPASSAVGRERKTLKGFLGGVVVPALRIDGWTFTGRTEHSRRPARPHPHRYDIAPIL